MEMDVVNEFVKLMSPDFGTIFLMGLFSYRFLQERGVAPLVVSEIWRKYVDGYENTMGPAQIRQDLKTMRRVLNCGSISRKTHRDAEKLWGMIEAYEEREYGRGHGVGRDGGVLNLKDFDFDWAGALKHAFGRPNFYRD